MPRDELLCFGRIGGTCDHITLSRQGPSSGGGSVCFGAPLEIGTQNLLHEPRLRFILNLRPFRESREKTRGKADAGGFGFFFVWYPDSRHGEQLSIVANCCQLFVLTFQKLSIIETGVMNPRKPPGEKVVSSGIGLPPSLIRLLDKNKGDYSRSRFAAKIIREYLAEPEGHYGELPVVVTDRAGCVMKINRAFTQMCGYTLKELRGKKPGDVLQGPATERDVVRDFRKAIKAIKPFTGTLSNYDKTGVLYRVHIQMRPLFQGTQHVGFEAVEKRLD